MEMNEQSTCPDMPQTGHNGTLVKTYFIICLKTAASVMQNPRILLHSKSGNGLDINQ